MTMVQLLRYQIFLIMGLVFLQLWRVSLNNKDTIKSYITTLSSTLSTNSTISSTTIDISINCMPLIAILTLGIYALTSVLYKVVTFGDCPEAALELSKEILVAKDKLKNAGFAY